MNLLSIDFWFSMRPVPLLPLYEKIIFFTFLAFIIISILIRVVVKKYNIELGKRLTRLSHLFLTMGAVGFLLFFFSYERAYVLGARFWYLFWIIGFFVWLGLIIRDLLKKMPQEKEEKNKKESFEKYLPKPKKKR